MNKLLNFILCFSLVFSAANPFAPIAVKLKGKTVTNNKVIENENKNAVSNKEDTEDNKYDFLATGFSTINFDGYATLGVPANFFKLEESESNLTRSILRYKDGKSTLDISYIRKIKSGTDIAGYLCNEVFKLDTTTNEKEEINIGNNTWTKVSTDVSREGGMVSVWFTANTNKTSAFFFELLLNNDSEGKEFEDALYQMLEKYEMYAVDNESGGGTIFETPSTGIYKDYKDSTVATHTGDYEEHSSDRTVFTSRGGYVLGAKISDDWRDFEIILDGHKISLPTRLKKITKMGFKIDDMNAVDSIDKVVYPGEFKKLRVKNKRGTIVSLILYNSNSSKNKKLKDCSIIGLDFNREVFDNIKETKENEYYNKQTKKDKSASKNAKDKYNHELVLAGGVTWGVYLDDLKQFYVNGTSENYDEETTMTTWKCTNGTMIINTGLISGIKTVSLRLNVEGQEDTTN